MIVSIAPRELFEYELEIIKKLISAAPGEHSELLADLDNVKVKPINPDGSIVEFLRPNYTWTREIETDMWPVEGHFEDLDGETVHVYLFIDKNNKLFELEFLKYGDSVVQEVNVEQMHLL